MEKIDNNNPQQDLGLTKDELKRYEDISKELRTSVRKLEDTQTALKTISDTQVPQVKELTQIIESTKKIANEILKENNKVTQAQVNSMMASFNTIDKLLKDNIEILNKRLDAEAAKKLPTSTKPNIQPTKPSKSSLGKPSTPYYFDPKIAGFVNNHMTEGSAILEGLFPGLGMLIENAPWLKKGLSKAGQALLNAPGNAIKSLFKKRDEEVTPTAEPISSDKKRTSSTKSTSSGSEALRKNAKKKSDDAEKKREKRHKEMIKALKGIEGKVEKSGKGEGGFLSSLLSGFTSGFKRLGGILDWLHKGASVFFAGKRGVDAYDDFKKGENIKGVENSIKAGLHAMSVIPALRWAGIAGELATPIGEKIGDVLSDWWINGPDRKRRSREMQEIIDRHRASLDTETDEEKREDLANKIAEHIVALEKQGYDITGPKTAEDILADSNANIKAAKDTVELFGGISRNNQSIIPQSPQMSMMPEEKKEIMMTPMDQEIDWSEIPAEIVPVQEAQSGLNEAKTDADMIPQQQIKEELKDNNQVLTDSNEKMSEMTEQVNSEDNSEGVSVIPDCQTDVSLVGMCTGAL